MTTYGSALSELSGRLIGTGSTLTNSLSEILARCVVLDRVPRRAQHRGLTRVKLVTPTPTPAS